MVRDLIGDVQIERLRGRRAAQEVQGVLCYHLALVVGGIGPVFGERAVLGEVVVEDRRFGGGQRRMPVVPAGWDRERIVFAVAVQVLAHEPGVVPGVVEPGRERVGRIEVAITVVVRADPSVVRVAAGQVGRPRRTAEREAHEAVRERRPLSRELRLNVGHERRVRRGRVVEHDHNDIRRLLVGSDRCRDAKQRDHCHEGCETLPMHSHPRNSPCEPAPSRPASCGYEPGGRYSAERFETSSICSGVSSTVVLAECPPRRRVHLSPACQRTGSARPR
jgi:hypothetical protein